MKAPPLGGYIWWEELRSAFVEYGGAAWLLGYVFVRA